MATSKNNVITIDVSAATMEGLHELAGYFNGGIGNALWHSMMCYMNETRGEGHKEITVPLSDNNCSFLAMKDDNGENISCILSTALSLLKEKQKNSSDTGATDKESCVCDGNLETVSMEFSDGYMINLCAEDLSVFLEKRDAGICAEMAVHRMLHDARLYPFTMRESCSFRFTFGARDMEYLRRMAAGGQSWAATVNDALDIYRGQEQTDTDFMLEPVRELLLTMQMTEMLEASEAIKSNQHKMEPLMKVTSAKALKYAAYVDQFKEEPNTRNKANKLIDMLNNRILEVNSKSVNKEEAEEFYREFMGTSAV